MKSKSFFKFRKIKRLLLVILALVLIFTQCLLKLVRFDADITDKEARLTRNERDVGVQIQHSPAPESSEYVPVEFFTGHYTRLRVPSVILRPIPGSGGIGDQLYRYAFAYTAARDLNATLYIVVRPLDLTDRRTYGVNDRKFALDHFRLNSTMVKYMKDKTYGEIPRGRAFMLDELGPWRPDELPHNKLLIVTEYWQSDMYFGRYKKELAAQIVPKDSVRDRPELRDLVDGIEQTESVAVHVRRGDFRGKEGKFWLYRVLPISYQLRAIRVMSYLLDTRRQSQSASTSESVSQLQRPMTFFVFSDDIEYARQHLTTSASLGLNFTASFIFVSGSAKANLTLTSIHEFELMRMCRHNIIPNSGYAWWTAWLNPNPTKLVIAPFPRHRYRFYPGYGLPGDRFRRHKEDLYWNHTYPDSWITLNPYSSYDDMM